MRLMITSRPGYEMLEYSCHEGNGAVGQALSGERVYEQQVADAKAHGLPIPARAVEHDQIRNGVPGKARDPSTSTRANQRIEPLYYLVKVGRKKYEHHRHALPVHE